MMNVVLTGTGAVRVNLRRGGPGQVVEVGGENLLVDCGRCTVHNLVRFGVPVETIRRVFVTHLHFDHVCDLPYLILLSWNNGRRHRIQIVGPKGTAEFLEAAVHQAYRLDIDSRLAHGKDPAGLEWDVTEIAGDGPVAGTDTWHADTLRTPHAGLDNYNFRFTTDTAAIVITSDTQWDESLIGFCNGADCLVCECSGTAEFLSQHPWGSWHMNPETVAELINRAGIRRAVIKHLVIENFSDDHLIAAKMARRIRELTGVTVDVGQDGMAIAL